MIDESQRYAARVYSIAFLLTLAIITLGFSRFYGPFLVANHPAETVRNFISHEASVRIYIICAVLYGVGNVVLLTALFIALRPVGRSLALLAALFRLVYVFMWFATLLELLDAIRLARGGDDVRVLGPDSLQALAASRLAAGWDAYYIGLTFYALGTVLFAYVFFRSRYIPRTIAALSLVASLLEAFCAFAYLVYPSFGKVVSVNYYEMPAFIEVVISLWILVRGLKQPETLRHVQAGAG